MKGKNMVLLLIILSVVGVIITWVLFETLDLQPDENDEERTEIINDQDDLTLHYYHSS